MQKEIKVAVVDDHMLVRESFKRLIGDFNGIEVVLEASDGNELLQKLKRNRPHVILMDIRMKGMNGHEATEQIAHLYPQIRILALSMFEDEHHITTMVEKGASGYLAKTASPKELETAIKDVMASGVYFNEETYKMLLEYYRNKPSAPMEILKLDPLNEQEKEIIQLICEEYTSDEIADKLCLSMRTVRNTRLRIMAKTKSKTVAGLVLYACKTGLVK